MIVSDNHSFQKRLMCEVEFFGRCFEERTLPFLPWSKLPPAIFKYPDSWSREVFKLLKYWPRLINPHSQPPSAENTRPPAPPRLPGQCQHSRVNAAQSSLAPVSGRAPRRFYRGGIWHSGRPRAHPECFRSARPPLPDPRLAADISEGSCQTRGSIRRRTQTLPWARPGSSSAACRPTFAQSNLSARRPSSVVD